jgi:hypothetical protein
MIALWSEGNYSGYPSVIRCFIEGGGVFHVVYFCWHGVDLAVEIMYLVE